MADWKRIREEYDRTTIDWEKLNAYAKRVASELSAKHPDRESWLLDTRYWQREDKLGPGVTETHRSTTNTYLTKDGKLVSIETIWSEILDPSSRPVFWENPKESFQYALSDNGVMMFDFEPKYYRTKEVSTNRDRSEKLLVHAKGVGLSKALKKLLNTH